MIRALTLIAFACGACAAVPDVTYATDDAAVVPDGGNTCPTQVPPWATSCCGPVACSGTNCAATCNDCVATCTLAALCCPNTQNHAVCKTNLQCQ